MPTMGLYRYRLLLDDDAEADPPVYFTAEANLHPGGTFVAGGRSFEIVDRRERPPTMTDIYAVLVVRPS